VSLALATLIYEWRRYLAAIIALSVAGLLVLALTGMFAGMVRSFTATVERSPAEVMVLPADADNLFANNAGLPRRLVPEIYRDPEVDEVQPLNFGFTGWSNFPKDGQSEKSTGVQLIILDPTPGSVSLPSDFGPGLIEALREPFAVVVDRSSLGKLGVGEGDRAKMNGYEVRVAGVTSGYPSVFNAMVFLSRRTAELLRVYNDGPRVGALVVKLHDAGAAPRVAAELNTMSHGQYRAWVREQLARVTQKSMLREGGIAVMVGFAVVVGAFIGIVITWQTLQGAILANIKEFASLRALGVSMHSLRLVVMELSCWIGIAGLGLTAGLAGLVWLLAEASGVPMDFPLFVDVPVAVSLLAIAILSGALSLRILKKSQPADLLR
jgi:putative ABC transport system permease protein